MEAVIESYNNMVGAMNSGTPAQKKQALRTCIDKLRAFLATIGFSNRGAQREVSQSRDTSR